MQRKFNFAPDEFYHVYNRGTEKRQIFLTEGDRLRFLVCLHVCNSKRVIHLSDWQGRPLPEMFDDEKIEDKERLVDLGAYCLMPNHYHLLIKEREGFGISKFLLKLQTSYSMYFNKRNNRAGNLFEGKFKAQHASDDSYLKYLFAYIHLNPVKIHDSENWEKKLVPNPDQAKKFLNDYRFSSYQHYIGANRPEDVILNRAVFPDYFQKPGEFAVWIDDWANYNE